jgi:hypothetical protein
MLREIERSGERLEVLDPQWQSLRRRQVPTQNHPAHARLIRYLLERVAARGDRRTDALCDGVVHLLSSHGSDPFTSDSMHSRCECRRTRWRLKVFPQVRLGMA